MKTILKALLAGAFASWLFVAAAHASSQTVNDSGTMVPSMNHNWLNAVYITTTGPTWMYNSGWISTGYNAGGGANVTDASSGAVFIQFSLASSGPGPATGSDNNGGYNAPAGNYKVTHGTGGYPDGFSWGFSTTLNW